MEGQDATHRGVGHRAAVAAPSAAPPAGPPPALGRPPQTDVRDGVTTPLRTVVDCARALPCDEALAVADSALRCRSVGPAALQRAATSARGTGSSDVRRVARWADGRAANLVRQLAAAAGVADVVYDSEWLGRVAGTLRTVRAAGLAMAALMALAAAVTVATVVRLGLHARRDEIEIMELVGAPLAFIRGPFVAEGFLQGGIGALVALLLLWMGFALAGAWWGTDIRTMLGGDELVPPVLGAG